LEVVGVSRAKTSGSFVTKSGRKAYRGKRRHWYVYLYDDDGKFKKRQISAVEVPYYGSLIRRRKSYQCGNCNNKFRSISSICPKCGAKSTRLERNPIAVGGGGTKR
jgi:rRNA maturation endonuclease Nob1